MKRFSDQELINFDFEEVMGSKTALYNVESDDFVLESAHVLYQGVCDSFALALYDEFGYDVFFSKELNHFFCRAISEGKTYYIDARGTCDSLNVLLNNRVIDGDLIQQDVEEIRRFEGYYSKEGYEFAKEFINQHRDYYKIEYCLN